MSDKTIYMKDYIDQSAPLISLMCHSQQWGGFTESDVKKWLDNFEDIEGRYYGTRILLHAICYSESDLIALLKYGLFDLILGDIVKRDIIRVGDISIANSILVSRVKELLDKTIFIPLLDKNKPHESGQQVLRYLVQNGSIKPSQSHFHKDITPDILDENKLLIVVDDCIGSGDQISDFWNSDELVLIRKEASSKSIKCCYLSLVGYKKQIETIRPSFHDLDIVICDYITDEHRVFSDTSVIWNDGERDEAIAYFKQLETQKGISMYGHNGLDFAVILHRNIPDWSLPILWQKVTDWEILIQRKNSYV